MTFARWCYAFTPVATSLAVLLAIHQSHNPMSIEHKGSYTVIDKRGAEKDKLPKPACRVCGAPVVHSEQYNKPTMECIKWLREQNAALRELVK